MKNRRVFLVLFVALFALLDACQFANQNTETEIPVTEESSIISNKVNGFDANIAYELIEKQLSFGFRIPGTNAHKQCSDWLFSTLKKYCDTFYYQKGKGINPNDGKPIPIYNLIGSFNPKAKTRILFAAHWDSRPFADQDDKNPTLPILAANDGASGVAVLLELARNLKQKKTALGIDIILFDAEDLGNAKIENSFCLGSQYWGRNLHVANYTAQFGVLLDMVGGKDATFMWEENSNEYANWILVHTWQIAKELGYENYFQFKAIGAITDDHKYVYEATKIPMIDIIQYDEVSGFAPYWHTHDDNLLAIDKNTLHAVGNTILHLVFNPPKYP